MHSFPKNAFLGMMIAAAGMFSLLAMAQPAGKPIATVSRVAALGGEVEVSTSQPLTPLAQMLAGPDRLVLDFPNALPGGELHNLAVNRGEVKGIRVGLFSKNPPVTRIVVDLKAPLSFQLSSSGKTVTVKLGSGNPAMASVPRRRPTLVKTSARLKPAPQAQSVSRARKLDVQYIDGKLSVWADKASLAEVLYEVQRQTGAEISIPPGAEQEQVVTSLGPATAREVLTSLLNGSRFNFIIVGVDPEGADVKSVLLTPRGEGVSQPVIYAPAQPAAQSQAEPQPELEPQLEPPQTNAQPEMQPAPQPDMQPEGQPEPQSNRASPPPQ